MCTRALSPKNVVLLLDGYEIFRPMKTKNAYVNFPVVIPFLSERARKDNLHLPSDLARACL